MIRVFLTTIDSTEDVIQKAISFLNGEELRRFSLIKTTNRSLQFLYGRVLVKTCLQRHFKLLPTQYVITALADHKPQILPASLEKGTDKMTKKTTLFPEISISHSGSHIVCALSTDGPIGIDIEQVKERSNLARLAQRVLAPAEKKVFRQLAKNEQHRYFYEHWTLKEAYYKAKGASVSNFSRLNFVAVKNRQFKLANQSDSRWQFFSFDLENSIVGAIALHAPKPIRTPAITYLTTVMPAKVEIQE